MKRWQVVCGGAVVLAMAAPAAAVPATADLRRQSAAPLEQTSGPADQTQIDAAQAAVRPVPTAAPPPAAAALVGGAQVDPSLVAQALADELSDDWLGSSVAIDIRDAGTGEVVIQQGSDTAVTPASLTKILTAAAVVRSYPMDEPFVTRVVAGPAENEIVLVAGGDALLATGSGDPGAVVGRAGILDLAEQVAENLRASSTDPAAADPAAPSTAAPEGEQLAVTLYLDTSYADGPSVAGGWTDYWVEAGFTGRITMLGLAQDRAVPYHPAPEDPAHSAALAFIDALQEFDVEVELASEEQIQRLSEADLPPVDLDDPQTAVLGEVSSAPVREVLALAMTESDNALTEHLLRVAAVREGVGTGAEELTAWLVEQLQGYGIDTTGIDIENGSGLAEDSVLPARVVTDILVLGAGDAHPELREMLTGLPVAALNGTMRDRFHLQVHQPGRGVVRAKTGSLPGVTSLAGTVVTADGRVLVFTVIADDIGPDGAAIEARSVVDEIVTELARCGC